MNRTRVNFARAARRLVPGLLLAGLAVVLSPSIRAAGPADSPYFGEPVVSESPPRVDAPTLKVGGLSGGGNSADLDPYFQVPGGGHGVMGRIGHVAGKTVGRDDSLTHINLQPYMFVNQNMFFSDLRMYRMNDGEIGGNIGGGWRRYLEDYDVILGAVGYYDVDDTRRQEFQQMGLSLEVLSRWLDVRGNWYIPFGETEQLLGSSFISGSQRFEGNQLLFDTVTTFGDAAEGVDVTFTSPVPWEILEPYHVEASAGLYHFQVRDKKLDSLWGYRLRVDASFFERMLHTFVELTSDRQHHTNVIIGASLDYYGGFESRSRVHDRQYYRMSEWVRRNYNIVTIDSDVVEMGVPVVNPDTGLPYFFAHIANNPTVGGPEDGTVENPFELINNAIATVPGADVYYVHGGSMFDGLDATITVPSDKILLGEGVPQSLPTVGFSNPVPLPVQRSGIVTLSNAVGNAITAGDNVLVGGFTIVNPSGNGVNVNGVVDGAFRDLTILGANGDGVLMFNPTGTFSFTNVTVAADDGIDGAGGVAFHVDGGNAMTTVRHVSADPLTNPTFENSGGNLNEVILIENTAGGFVNLAPPAGQMGGPTAASDDGGGGIRVLNNLGNVTLGSAQLVNTMVVPGGVGAGVELRNNAATTTISGDITVDNAAGVGFLVEDLPAAGVVVVSGTANSNITIDNRNAIGADFRNIDGQVRFNDPASLTIGPIAGAGPTDPALRFSASTGSVALNSTTINGSVAEGILIGDPAGVDVNTSTARFITTGTTTITNVGVLDDLATPSIRIQGSEDSPEASTVEFRENVTINERLARGIHIQNASLDVDGMRSRIAFSGLTTVNNNNLDDMGNPEPSGLAALFVRNGAGAITFDTFIANDSILDESALDIRDVTGGVAIDDLRINNATGTGAALPVAGLLVDNVASFSTADGAIEVLNETAVNIEESGYQVALTSVDSINPDLTILPEFGIRLVDNVGQFSITGDGATFGSGGTIANTTTAGLFADDADQVFIRFQDYLSNRRSLEFQNMNEDDTQGFVLDSLRVTGSETEAVLATNVRNILIEDSIFQDNGALDLDPGVGFLQSDTIAIVVTEVPDDPLDPIDQDNPEDFPYTYTIQRNQFLDTILGFQLGRGADGVSIQTSTGNARGARLDLFFLDNNFVFDRSPAAVGSFADFSAMLLTNWDGIINADILRNVGNIGPFGGQRGFNINQTNPNDPLPSRINLSNNELTFVGGATLLPNIGANFTFANTVQITVDNNDFDLGTTAFGVMSDALRFRLLDLNNLVDVTNNTLLVNGVGTGVGTGVNFEFVSDGSRFFIEGNEIGDVANPVDRGIRFGTILGTATLFGTAPNFVTVVDATDPDSFFSVGSGTVAGQININGVFVP